MHKRLSSLNTNSKFFSSSSTILEFLCPRKFAIIFCGKSALNQIIGKISYTLKWVITIKVSFYFLLCFLPVFNISISIIFIIIWIYFSICHKLGSSLEIICANFAFLVKLLCFTQSICHIRPILILILRIHCSLNTSDRTIYPSDCFCSFIGTCS